MTLSLTLEHTSKPEQLRAIIMQTEQHGYRPITFVHDIAEGSSTDLMFWLTDNYNHVTHVRLSDGSLDEPDCLTVFEAAEAAMLPYEIDP
jgi:hypothetical protein